MLARQQPAPTQCRHCGDNGIDAPGTACVLCGKRETDAKCARCLDTGSYEVASGRGYRYTDVETVRCACVRMVA